MLFVSRYIEMFIKNRQQQGVNVLNRKEEISSKERSVVGDHVGPKERNLLLLLIYHYVMAIHERKNIIVKEGSLDFKKDDISIQLNHNYCLLRRREKIICHELKEKLHAENEAFANYDTLALVVFL